MKALSLFTLILTAGLAQTALAHTELAATVPADRAAIDTAPEQVELRFSEPVRLTALAVQKDGAAKRSLGPLPAETTEKFAVALPALEDGHYTVTWRALSEDTHVMSGDFMFAVGAGAHDEHMNHAAAPAGAHDEHMDHADEHDEHLDDDHHDDHHDDRGGIH